MRSNIIYIIILVTALIVVIVVFQTYTPREVDWSDSYSKDDTIPGGSYILYQLLPNLFPNRHIFVAESSIYDVTRNRDLNSMAKYNYIIINKVIDLDEFDTKRLVEHVENGAHVFIAAQHFMGTFGKKYKLNTMWTSLMKESMGINFTSRFIRNREDYQFEKNTANFHFTSFDTDNTSILGVNANGEANFIRIRAGKGAFYLSCLPLVYTNYNMLSGNNHEYIFKSLSYLPVRDTMWDEYYKASRIAVRAPLRFVLSKEPLRWAYYLIMSSVLLFIVFKARRKQRVVPVIEPPKNASLDFIQTIGRLYFHHGKNKDIADKKIIHFLDNLRSHYFIETSKVSEKYYGQISDRTGIPAQDVERLFKYMNRIEKNAQVSDSELMKLNSLIENFYRRANGKFEAVQSPRGK